MALVNLADTAKANAFVNAYTMLLSHADLHPHSSLRDFELEFVSDMQDRFQTREDAADLGVTQWNPTDKQYRYLLDLKGIYCG